MLGIGEICIKSKKFPIISTVYMNIKFIKAKDRDRCNSNREKHERT